MSHKVRSNSVVVILALLALAGIGRADAHAKLTGSDPTANATVSAPTLIRLKFDDELAKQFSSLRLTDTDGNPVPMMATDTHDARSLAAMPTMALGPGLYTVSWIAVSTDDGHKTMGSFSFTVQ